MALFFKQKEKKPEHLLALDIGTASVKALLFTIDEEKAVIKGFGEQKQGVTHMRGGVISDLDGVIDNCEKAITMAANQAGASPEKMILGVAGQTIKGLATFFRFERTDPEAKLTEDEIQEMVDRIQKTALANARQAYESETGKKDVAIKLVNSSMISAKVDGYEVPNLSGFKGKDIEVGFFDAYALSVHLDTLQSLADELGLEIHAISAEPFSLVSGILPTEKESLAGIVLDIGGTVTDLTLIKQGRILGTKVLPLGSSMITDRIVEALKIPFDEADSKKAKYIENDTEPTVTRKIKEAIEPEVALWVKGVELAIKEWEEEALPPHFLLCGGGAALPEIKAALVAYPWLTKTPFTQFPKVDFILPDNVLTVFDQTGAIKDSRLVTPMCLCKVALDLEKEEDLIARLLSKSAHKMGI